MLPLTVMAPFLCKSSKQSPAIFLLGLLGLIVIGVTNSSASPIPLQSEGPSSLTGDDPFATEQSNEIGTSFSAITANEIRLDDYQTQTISAAPGSTVTLNLQNFVLTDHATLTLLGSATSTFIINVTNQFSLAKSAKVVLSGGLQWNNVFFNILGKGPAVTLRGNSSLIGTITANQRKVRLKGHAIVYGAVFAHQLVIRQSAQVIPLPIVSQ